MIKGNIDCPCGCGLTLTQRAMNALKTIASVVKKELNIDLIVNSGARCPNYNIKIGGAKNSTHPLGEAFDIDTPNSKVRFIVLKTAIEIGIKRIGWNRDKKFLHLDCCTKNDRLPHNPDQHYEENVAFDY